LPSSSIDPVWRRTDDDGALILQIHAQPGAKRTEIVGVHGDALHIRLAAPPVEGKANDALRVFLAEVFGVPRKNVALIRGHRGRRKTVRIEAPLLRPDRAWD